MMSLIHHGKILKNEQTAKDAGIKENVFVVLMVKKKKRKRKAKQKKSLPTRFQLQLAARQYQQSKKSATTTDANSSEAPAASAVSATENPAAAQNDAPSAANAFVMGSQLDTAVQNLMAMGFSEADVQRAMRAAFNNPERAAEYLLTGIPPNIGAAAPSQVAAPPPAAQSAAVDQAAAANNPMAAAAMPQQGAALGAMQQMIAQNPESMAAVLQHIMRNQPELFQGIGADGNINPAAIENLLQDPNFTQMMLQAMSGGASVGAMPGMGSGQLPMSNPNVIRMSHAEAAAVERLKNIGFSQQQAVEAFLVCNKNEQMAANYLFENANDFAGPAAAAAPAAQAVAEQPVNAAPQVAPPVQPIAAVEQVAAVPANDAQDESLADEGPANQMEAMVRARQAERDEAKNNDNADGGDADAKDQEMGDPNK